MLPFSDVAAVFQETEKRSGRLEMTDVLAALLKRAGADEIGKLVYFIQGIVAFISLEFFFILPFFESGVFFQFLFYSLFELHHRYFQQFDLLNLLRAQFLEQLLLQFLI